MTKRHRGLNSTLVCPECGSSALYRYGKVHHGLQRIMCIVCGRQFVPGHVRASVANRPICPQCGKSMHLYRREDKVVRFRCSTYPGCRAYLKLMSQEVLHYGELRA